MAGSQMKRGRSATHRSTLTRTVAIAVVTGNLVAYAGYRVVQKVRPSIPTAATPAEPSSARGGRDQGLARARRVAGLAALEEGDYPAAAADFADALQQGAGGDVPELLRIAKDLEDRHRARPTRDVPSSAMNHEAPPAAVAPTVVAEARSKQASPASGAEARSRAAAQAKSFAHPKKPTPNPRPAARSEALEPPAPSLLLVTSTPSGILVEVDGKRMDFTPARLKVSPGAHTVVLMQGDQRLYERRVEVQEEGMIAVDADLTERLRPPTPAPVSVESAHALPLEHIATAAVDSASPGEHAPPAPTTRAVARPAPHNTSALALTGEVHVVSSSVYGEVWINGQAVGFPPLVAKGLAPGPATVEVRVNGVVRRTKVVEVQASRRAVVYLR